jgi:hypothetical protein
MTLLLSAAEAAVLAPLQAVVFQEYVSRASISGASAFRRFVRNSLSSLGSSFPDALII